MYHLQPVSPDTIIDVFEEFIGCAVSSLIVHVVRVHASNLHVLTTFAINPKSNSKGYYREETWEGDQLFFIRRYAH